MTVLRDTTSITVMEAFYPNGCATAIIPPHSQVFQERPHPLRTLSLDSAGSCSDMDELNAGISLQDRSQRSRRRQQPGMQHVKHRRTRSGCYTCRQRRIKCDERRPICDRCSKGKRDCNYPGGSASATKQSPKAKYRDSLNANGSDRSDGDLDEAVIEASPVMSSSDIRTMEDVVKTPSIITTDISLDASSTTDSTITSPATTTSTAATHLDDPQMHLQDRHQHVKFGIEQSARWLALPTDVRFLLTYHRDRLLHTHYAFRYDYEDFLKTTFLEFAMNDESEALLYAIVAFAAHHYTLACGDPAISNFLSYYDKSIVLLQKSLKSKHPDIVTLLTVLQLATIEECLGDWTNMLGHQKAAYQILTTLYTPQTILQDAARRQIVRWYMRFDLFSAMLCHTDVCLDREWFLACRDFCKVEAKRRPLDLRARFVEFSATFQLLAADMCTLVSLRSETSSDDAKISRATEDLVARFAEYGNRLERSFSECSSASEPLWSSSPSTKELVESPAELIPICEGELFALNYLVTDFWAVDLLFRHHVQLQALSQLSAIALRICGMVEAIVESNHESSSAINCRSSLYVASYFLPKERKYIDWVRTKFAMIEQMGCMYPATLRKQTFAMWGLEYNGVWLPEHECASPVLNILRDFVEYRRASVPAISPDGAQREISGIFTYLHVDARVA